MAGSTPGRSAQTENSYHQSTSSSGRGSANTSAATPSSNGDSPSYATTVTRWGMSGS